MKDHIGLIQQRIDSSINRILGVTSVISFVSSIILYIADLPVWYALVNLMASFVLLLFFLFAKKFKTSYKIFIMLAVTTLVGFASYIGGSFSSAFSILFILTNIIAVLFLQRKQSLIISIATLCLMFILAFYSIFISPSQDMTTPFLTWGLQLSGFILVLIVLQISVQAIQNYLIENMDGLKRSNEITNWLAYYDQLTKLPNRYKFKLDAMAMIDDHKRNGFILLFSLKNLNLINSTLGQTVGDQTLHEIATVLHILAGEHAVVSRTGGSEFAIWLDNISEADLPSYFESLMNDFGNQSMTLKKKMEFYAVYAEYHYGEETFKECYQRTELTLIYAKTQNIQSLISYDSKLKIELHRKETIKNTIVHALENEEFLLYYQAKYDSRTHQVVGVEALARLYDEKLGFISPYEFIPIIESLNLSIQFGNFVIEQACKDFRALQKKYNEDIHFSINISPTHIMNPSIVQNIRKALQQYQVPQHRLTIEITEDILIQCMNSIIPILSDLKNLGIKMSLDDFGTGYSSLYYLTQLELDELKIDKSFIDQIGINDNIQLLLENIVYLSEQFGLELVAEGVETKEQNDLLSSIGCYTIQGYYFAKPEPLR